MDSLNEYDNKLRHGHTKNSTAHQKYIHPTAKSADKRFLKGYGLEPEIEEDVLPIICKSCKMPNSRDREVCYCGRALSIEAAVKMDKQDNEKFAAMENTMEKLMELVAPIKEMLNQNEIKIPMNSLPKDVQEKIERLNLN
jgi:hypothetical protein